MNFRTTVYVALFVGAASVLTVSSAEAKGKDSNFCLTVLHNNDAESQLIDAGAGIEDFGGADRFLSLLGDLRRDANRFGCSTLPGGDTARRTSITVSSGDNFLAGPELNASLAEDSPFYDALLVAKARYDALALGNHEFDFGPDVLADFIQAVGKPTVFLSANLDFSFEPRLAALVDNGQIGSRHVVTAGGRKVGIVGATTPNLASISSPRDVIVDDDIAAIVQTEIDALEAQGIDIIVLISHLQDIDADRALIQDLSGLDIAVAGGGDELLANIDTLLVPGDESLVFGPYPLTSIDKDGNEVPVVTTAGNLKYIGALEVLFDKDGNVQAFAGEPKRVSGVEPDAVRPRTDITRQVKEPLQAFVADLENNVIGDSEVALDGLRSSVRSAETNQGNLLADALRWQASLLAASFGQPVPDIALQNGGGMRGDNVIPAGPITELDTFEIAPFTNFVTIVPNVTRAMLKKIMENAVSRVAPGDIPGGTGRFAQISGMSMVYDPAGTAYDPTDNTVIPTRVRGLVLDDGTELVTGGVIVPGPDVTIATIDFLARGGDEYPFDGAPFTSVGVTYQQALSSYISDELGGVISAADYPEGGGDRITITP